MLLQRCLQKDKSLRLRDAGDARIEILAAMAAPQDAGAAHVPTAKSKLLGALAAGLAITAVFSLWGWWRATRPVEPPLRPLVHLDVGLGSDLSVGAFGGANVILSPDGTRLVYMSQERLFTRRLDQPNGTELVGTQGASEPFFSPDGRWVAFFAMGKLMKISVDGDATVSLCDTASPRGGTWGEDGNIIFAFSGTSGLSRIPSDGGAPTSVTELENGEVTHRWPQILPGDKAVLFTSHTRLSGFDGANIEVLSLADHRRKTLQRGGTFGRYLPSGHLVYVTNDTLFAVPFDLNRLEVRGTPVPVLEKVGYSARYGSTQLDFSQTGTLLYQSGGGGPPGGLATVQWLDDAGRTRPLLGKSDFYVRPRLSPDGQRLAISVSEEAGQDIWIYELQRDTMSRLTFGGVADGPIWSPDGQYVVFRDSSGMSWIRSDGAGRPQRLTQTKTLQYPESFTADGKRLAFQEVGPGGYDLWTLPLENDGAGFRPGKPEPFLQTPFDERHDMFSPDGRWMAYSSNESGSYQVYVRAFPDKGGKWQISNGGGVYPIWARNGRELFFRTEDNRIMVVSYTVKGDSFVADKPHAWSDKPIANIGMIGNYDLAPDGKRIAALMPVETAEAQKAQNQVTFLENFFDEIRRKVPPGK